MTGNTVVYNSQLDAFTLYHVIQETSPSASSKTGVGPALPALGHAATGSIATACAKLLLYPLDLMVTRLQVQRQLKRKGEAESAARDADAEYTSVLDGFRKIYKSEGGFKAFYTGCIPDVGKGIADSFLFFLAYTFVRQYELRKRGGKNLPVLNELGVGIAAGAFAKLITTPIQTVVTRQQTAALVAARDPTSTTTPGESDQLNMKDIALQIRCERGLAGFWAGYSASVILTLNPAITFALDNLIRRLLPKARRESPGPHLTFLIAAVSKALATSLTYPVMLAKARAQATQPNAEDDAPADGPPAYLEKPNMNSTPRRKRMKEQMKKALRLLSAQYAIMLSLQKIYKHEGISGLYSGLDGEVLKGFLSHGLTMVMKENVHIGVIQTYYLLLKLTKRWPAELQKAQQNAKDIAADAQERAVNVGETVSEGTKQLLEVGKRRANGALDEK